MGQGNPIFEAVWNIKNFSSIGNESPPIKSQYFKVENFEDSVWSMWLTPQNERTEYISIRAFTKYDEERLQGIECEFCLLDCKGFDHMTTLGEGSVAPRGSKIYSAMNFFRKEDLFEQQDKFIQEDTLRVCFRAWNTNSSVVNESFNVILSSERRVVRISDVWNINKSIKSDEKRFKIFPNNDKFLIHTKYTRESDTFLLSKEFEDNKAVMMLKWKVEIEATGEIVADYDFSNFNKLEGLFFSSSGSIDVSKAQELVFHFTSYSSNMVHSLQCGLASVLASPCNSYQSNITSSPFTTKMLSSKPRFALNKDFARLQQEQYMADFTLRVQTSTYPVHSLVLGARSPVFKSMFQSGMTEATNKTLVIEDISPEVVSKMLQYIYTDDPGHLTVDKAIKLFYAGDKYQLLDLKSYCSDVLKCNLAVDNVCDVLELAYMHDDDGLIEEVIQFMHRHETVIFSADWNELMQRNSVLTSKTMYRLFQLKAEPSTSSGNTANNICKQQ